MQKRALGNLHDISRLTLGGGGIGQVWGNTSRDEAIATVLEASAAGINLFDMAPIYGANAEAEIVMGLAFANGYPKDLHVTTKCMLGATDPQQIASRLTASLDASMTRMKRDFVDLFILHGYVIPDDWQDCAVPAALPRVAVEWSNFRQHVIPTFERLKAEGRIGGWGITAAGPQETNLEVIQGTPKPDVVQCITNLLDSPGSMHIAREAPDPRTVIRTAAQHGVGVMGIRAVAAGSLAASIDRAVKPHSTEQRDYDRAAGFRAIAAELGIPPAILAHRYALSMDGVDTLVLGVKNRQELQDCLAAEAAPNLDSQLMRRIEAAVAVAPENTSKT
jgi:aryl-alcohol dehydrogenase-like predicted oxidoreductase